MTRTAVVVVAVAALAACQGAPAGPTAKTESPKASQLPVRPADVSRSDLVDAYRAGPSFSDGRPQRAQLTIPSLGLRNLTVVPYVGQTDDARGTRIQDRGLAASPHGPRGGVGPGGRGNYQVTAHRTSSTQAFIALPSLRVGERAVVTAGGVRYIYEIRATRQTSFRSTQSLAEQRAAVPGHPGKAATKAFITLSTCATPEDHARGNYWQDRFHNPEHRIDKIGVLVQTTARGK